MPATIRLMRVGKKGYPTYRIVVVDKRKKRNSDYLALLGSYNPMVTPVKLELDRKQLSSWIAKGAVVSEGMTKLLKSVSKKDSA